MFTCKIYPRCLAPTAPPLQDGSLVRGKLPGNKPHPSTVSTDSLLFQMRTHTRARARAHAPMHTHTQHKPVCTPTHTPLCPGNFTVRTKLSEKLNCLLDGDRKDDRTAHV